MPNIHHRYPNDHRLCRVLGIALLYICLSSNEDVLCPDALRDRVKDAYAALGIEEEEPIAKIELRVYRMPNGTFGISDAVPTEEGLAGPQGPGAPMTIETGQTILVRMDAVNGRMTQYNTNVMNGPSKSRAENRKLCRIMNNNL